MAPAFARCMATVMDNLHLRDIGNPADLSCPQTDVKIFKIEEKSRIKPSELLQNICAKQHKTTTDNGWVPQYVMIIKLICHLIFSQARLE
ncbi:hypothetical protein AT59_10985 [Aeromonas hydrophila AD9]|nr:hypothetical protein AT59_10985 [Aeromonas hydrophila AD9]